MKILIVGDFKEESGRRLLVNARKFGKGFVRNGHDVMEFCYRAQLQQLSPIKSKNWAVKIAKKKVDEILAELARHYQPELVFLTTFKLLDVKTIRQIKAAAQALLICWYEDATRGLNEQVLDIGRMCDFFLATSGGELLQRYKQAGVRRCAFMPNPSDKDIEHPREVPDKCRSKILFTGKLRHGQDGQDEMRRELIKWLVDHKDMTVWGCMGQKTLQGIDYLNAICGAEMALSINVFNDVRFYHSDRLTHYLGCGAFVLAKRVPDSDLLFEDHKHLCYFDTKDQCAELIERFQQDAGQRRKIAAAGRERVHKAFGCEKLARYIVDLATQGEYQDSWAEII
ncbi:MAG: hypothetical protein AMJ79_04145 [Phycisphaerae bacterium SM23_30]|nr:MAG: hypothetical protein AMJ79_04145 [Phycisphaerae bacterium SM23_30]